MPGRPDLALASLGNYLFSTQVLVDTLVASREASERDFGRHIIPGLFRSTRAFAYDFQTNAVPGIQPYEEAGYWRDVGTLDAYWRAHMDLLGEHPRLDLANRRWPILSDAYHGPPARIVRGDIENAQFGEGSVVRRATVRNSILGRGVSVDEGAVIEDSIVMDFTSVGKGAHIRRSIVDRYNIIPAGLQLGLDPDADRERFRVDSSGLVVVPRGGRREFLWNTEAP
jgi:glucose-1-phosphate adenylyltransferase